MQPTTTTATSYDYSSLTLPVTEAERQELRRRDSKTGVESLWAFAVVGSILALVFSFLFLTPLLDGSSFSGGMHLAIRFMVWAGLTGLCVWGVQALGRHRLDRLVRLDRFARQNGLQFSHEMEDPGYAGMIFDEGHSRVLNESLTLADGTQLANYTYVTGSGKNQTTHTWSFVRVPLERAVPHMVLDAKRNNLFGKLSNLTDTFDKNQTLSLEGDFDNHFTLYAPQQYGRDALYIFTPDVMAALIDNGNDYDMEAIGNELYIYKNTPINMTDAGELTSLFGIVSIISSELRSQTKRYADERVGDRTMNIIAPQGAQLRRGVNWFVVGMVVAFLGYYLLPTLLAGDGITLLPFIVPAIFGVIAVVAVIKKMKSGS